MWQRCFWLVAVIAWGLTAEGQTVFRNVFGDSSCYDEGYSVAPYNNGYLVSAAYLCGNGWQSRLVILNAIGDSTDVATTLPYNGYMHPSSDGNIIFIGGNRAGLVYDTIVIAKVSQVFDTVWIRRLFFPECNNQVYDLIEVADGYVLTGIYSYTICNNGPAYKAFATKLDNDGAVVWSQTYGTADDNELFVVRERPNGDLWFYGWQRENGNTRPWLLITDEAGDSLSSYTGGMLGDGFGYGMDVTADGGIITIHYADSIYAQKLDAGLNLQWETSLGIQSGGVYFRAFETLDRNFAFLACLSGNTGCNSHLFKLDTTGSIKWAKSWDGLLREATEPEPGQFLLTGYTNAFPVLPEALVVRFDTIYDSIPNVTPSLHQEPNIRFYPNPAESQIYIQSSESIAQIELYSIEGQKISSTLLQPTLQYTMQLHSLPQALYLLRVTLHNGQTIIRKLVVER